MIEVPAWLRTEYEKDNGKVIDFLLCEGWSYVDIAETFIQPQSDVERVKLLNLFIGVRGIADCLGKSKSAVHRMLNSQAAELHRRNRHDTYHGRKDERNNQETHE